MAEPGLGARFRRAREAGGRGVSSSSESGSSASRMESTVAAGGGGKRSDVSEWWLSKPEKMQIMSATAFMELASELTMCYVAAIPFSCPFYGGGAAILGCCELRGRGWQRAVRLTQAPPWALGRYAAEERRRGRRKKMTDETHTVVIWTKRTEGYSCQYENTLVCIWAQQHPKRI